MDVIHADRTQQQVKSNVNFQSNKELSTGIYEALVFHSQSGTKTSVVCSLNQRDNTVHSFRAGKIWVLICTALLARGIDFKGVNLVINYDFPTSSVEYIHRIGESRAHPHSSVLARLPESLQHVHFFSTVKIQWLVYVNLEGPVPLKNEFFCLFFNDLISLRSNWKSWA